MFSASGALKLILALRVHLLHKNSIQLPLNSTHRSFPSLFLTSPMGCRFRAAPPCSSFLLGQPRPKLSCNTLLCCIRGPENSTSSTQSPSWYSPSRQKPQSSSPETDRHWVTADFTESSLLLSEERLMIVSYNILGDRNALNHRDMYRNVASVYLEWDYRKRLICDELLSLSADIICLQEVDKYTDILEVLENAGYQGSFKRRTGGYVDGCAMFWKADKLRLLEEESIEYKRYGLRDNVAQLSLFEMCKAKGRTILVGNIHVLFNPRRGDVKLGQIRLLLSMAHVLSKKWGDAPIVLAGDYNSTPQGAIYRFLTTSELNIMLHDRGELSGQKNCRPSQSLGVIRENGSLFALMDRFLHSSWTAEEIETATGGTRNRVVTTPFKLRSSYAMVKDPTRGTRGIHGEPEVTSYHSKFLGTVDYLWFSDGVAPTKVLDTLPFTVLKKLGSLPSEKLGSDHLTLVSEYAFVESTKDKNDAGNGNVTTS